MYFSRIDQQGMLRDKPLATLGHIHSKAYEFFGEARDRKRDFLFRFEIHRGRPRFYVLSEEQPREMPSWRVATKPYAPVLKAGDRLQFSLRMNPTVGVDGKRHGLLIHHLTKHPEAKARHRGELTYELVFDWLNKRGESHGFVLETNAFRVERYQKERFFKKGKTQPVVLTIAEVEGILTVTDPTVFSETLKNGLGRAKGYGCGLMMIRRA